VPGDKTVCKKCGKSYLPTIEPDPCLGMIPGVAHACCGHGNIERAYVTFGSVPSGCVLSDYRYNKDFLYLRKKDALKFFKLVEKAREDKFPRIVW
jgi:hypothetical protein